MGTPFTTRPVITGRRGVVTSGHYLATAAGFRILSQGGDAQDQWTLQFFLNRVVFGMNLQEALDAPTVYTSHFPSSFYPREAHARAVSVENRIAPEVRAELERRGHKVTVSGDWSHGRVLAVAFDRERGTLSAAASPRQSIAYAMGW